MMLVVDGSRVCAQGGIKCDGDGGHGVNVQAPILGGGPVDVPSLRAMAVGEKL